VPQRPCAPTQREKRSARARSVACALRRGTRASAPESSRTTRSRPLALVPALDRVVPGRSAAPHAALRRAPDACDSGDRSDRSGRATLAPRGHSLLGSLAREHTSSRLAEFAKLHTHALLRHHHRGSRLARSARYGNGPHLGRSGLTPSAPQSRQSQPAAPHGPYAARSGGGNGPGTAMLHRKVPAHPAAASVPNWSQ